MSTAEQGPTEDALLIERTQVRHFTGDAVHIGDIFVFTLRHCHLVRNADHGLRVRGCDGFVLDCWISANGGAGFAGLDDNLSMTLTGNRIEWNRLGGILSFGGTHYNITGNYIDRNGGAGIDIRPRGEVPATVMAITGNIIYRSGKDDWHTFKPERYGPGSPLYRDHEPFPLGESTNVSLVNAHGISFTGNTLCTGRDDNYRGQFSPRFAILYEALANSVIAHNTLFNGATEQLLLVRGGHGAGVVVESNPGRVFDGAMSRTFNI